MPICTWIRRQCNCYEYILASERRTLETFVLTDLFKAQWTLYVPLNFFFKIPAFFYRVNLGFRTILGINDSYFLNSVNVFDFIMKTKWVIYGVGNSSSCIISTNFRLQMLKRGRAFH
jgi:hypothetical protein